MLDTPPSKAHPEGYEFVISALMTVYPEYMQVLDPVEGICSHTSSDVRNAAICYIMPEPVYTLKDAAEGYALRTPWPWPNLTSPEHVYYANSDYVERLDRTVKAMALLLTEMQYLQTRIRNAASGV